MLINTNICILQLFLQPFYETRALNHTYASLYNIFSLIPPVNTTSSFDPEPNFCTALEITFGRPGSFPNYSQIYLFLLTFHFIIRGSNNASIATYFSIPTEKLHTSLLTNCGFLGFTGNHPSISVTVASVFYIFNIHNKQKKPVIPPTLHNDQLDLLILVVTNLTMIFCLYVMIGYPLIYGDILLPLFYVTYCNKRVKTFNCLCETMTRHTFSRVISFDTFS